MHYGKPISISQRRLYKSTISSPINCFAFSIDDRIKHYFPLTFYITTLLLHVWASLAISFELVRSWPELEINAGKAALE